MTYHSYRDPEHERDLLDGLFACDSLLEELDYILRAQERFEEILAHRDRLASELQECQMGEFSRPWRPRRVNDGSQCAYERREKMRREREQFEAERLDTESQEAA